MALAGRMTHIGLCVSDMERSLRFYCEALGFVRSADFPDIHVAKEPSDTLLGLRDVDLQAVYLERDGFRLELLHFASPRSPGAPPERSMNDLGLTHLSIRVPDVRAAASELERAGATIQRETEIAFDDMVVAVFLRDPDGLPIELVRGG